MYALKGLAQIERDSGSTEQAISLYEEAVTHCRRAGDQILLAHTIRHLGDAYQDVDAVEKAENCYREALALYRESSSVRGLDLANAVRPFAILKERTGDTAKARELWVEAHELYTIANATAGIEESARHLENLFERDA